MNEIRNKPKVFLSHSKQDIQFVQRICDDLRHCQIEPWLDSEEIRHGEPWLDAIFESGIPTCDAVLVYLTASSLESKMVKKEIDASLITKLRDSRISFLPYVCDPEVRTKLRSDLQALQAPEWSNTNYATLLPRVVAEIWRGFMERSIAAVISEEKVKRLEAELAISNLKAQGGGIFTSAEDSDFRYVWESLNKWHTVRFVQTQEQAGKHVEICARTVRVNVRSVVPLLATANTFEYYSSSASRLLLQDVLPNIGIGSDSTAKTKVGISQELDISDELLLFGLMERRERPYRPDGIP